MWSYSLYSLLCFFIYFGSSSIIYKGVSYDIFKWSEVPFPANFSVGLNATSPKADVVLIQPQLSKKAALATIDQLIMKTKVKGILISGMRNEFMMDWIRDNNLAKNIPVGMFVPTPSYSDFRKIVGNTSIYVQFDGWDLNYQYELSRTYNRAARIIDIVLIICCLLWASSKIYLLIKDKQFSLNIAPVCLCIEVGFNCIRLTRSSLLYNELTAPLPGSALPDNLTLWLYTLSFAFNLSSGIFIIFFWLNLMKMKFSKLRFFDKAFWPSFVMIAVLFILVIIFGALNIGKTTNILTLSVTGSFLTLFTFIVAVLYFIIAYQVFMYTRNRSGSDDMNYIAIKIVLSGLCFVTIVAFSINQLITRNIGAFFLVHASGSFIMDILYSIRSFLQVDVFGTIKKKKQTVVVMDSKDKDKNSSTNSVNSSTQTTTPPSTA